MVLDFLHLANYLHFDWPWPFVFLWRPAMFTTRTKIQPTHLPNNLMTHGSALNWVSSFLQLTLHRMDLLRSTTNTTTLLAKSSASLLILTDILISGEANLRSSSTVTIFLAALCFTINDKRQTTTINDKRQANINTQLGNHPAQFKIANENNRQRRRTANAISASYFSCANNSSVTKHRMFK